MQEFFTFQFHFLGLTFWWTIFWVNFFFEVSIRISWFIFFCWEWDVGDMETCDLSFRIYIMRECGYVFGVCLFQSLIFFLKIKLQYIHCLHFLVFASFGTAKVSTLIEFIFHRWILIYCPFIPINTFYGCVHRWMEKCSPNKNRS